MDLETQGSTRRRSSRLILQNLKRPIDGPVHINLEDDDFQMSVKGNNVEKNVVGDSGIENEAGEVIIAGIENNSDDDFVSPAPWSKTKKKRLDGTFESRKVKRKLIVEEKDGKKKPKGKNKNDKRQGNLRLVDEETDDDVPEPQRVINKEAQMKGKRKLAIKSNVDEKIERRGKQKIEERTEIAKKHGHFVKYLMENNYEFLATSLKDKRPSYVSMPWQTLSNFKDCGIFLMRHMETYKGDAKHWISDLKNEANGQIGQLEKLRAKYCHAILVYTLNEKRQQILGEAKILYNKMASEKVMNLVVAASQGKTVHVVGRKKMQGKILFPDVH